MAKGSILIHSGRVFDGDRFIESNVFVKDGIIAYIGKDCPSADYEYNAENCIVSPGLIDSHIHMRGVSPETYGTSAEGSCFPFGVTAAVDAGAMYSNVNLLNSIELKTLVFVSVKIRDNKPDFENTEKLLAAYGEKAIGVKAVFDEGGIRDMSVLSQICDFAAERNLRVMLHSTGTTVSMAQLLSVLRKGDICTHIYHGGINNAADDDFTCLVEARQRDIVLDAGMAGGVHTDFEILQSAIDKGVLPDIISSDLTSLSAFTRAGRYGLTMCMSIFRALGMEEAEVFKAVTSAPAKLLDKENEWGALKIGRNADIAVISYVNEMAALGDRWGHSIKFDNGYRCKLTVCDGRIVYKD